MFENGKLREIVKGLGANNVLGESFGRNVLGETFWAKRFGRKFWAWVNGTTF